MEYRQLGRSGLQVSAVGLGANPFGLEVDEAGAAAVVNRAIDLGVTYIDTADIYQEGRSEDYLGKALRGRRHEVVLGTKAAGAMGPGPMDRGASRKHLMDAIHASLRRLQTDYIDLYHIHHPDPLTPAEETMRTLDDLVRAGTVRYIGCSNYAAWQVAEAMEVASLNHYVPFISAEEHYNLLYRGIEQELIPTCQSYGLGIIPYFPLAGAFLTGAYRRGQPAPPKSRGTRPTFVRWTSDRNWNLLEQLERFAKERNHSTTELALAWLLSRPSVSTIIPGAENPQQIEENVRAGEWRLSDIDLAELDRITAS